MGLVRASYLGDSTEVMENTVTVDRMWRSKINGNFIWGADQQTKVAPTKFEKSIEGVGFRMLKQIGRRAVFEVATYLELQDVRWPVTLDNPLVVRVNGTTYNFESVAERKMLYYMVAAVCELKGGQSTSWVSPVEDGFIDQGGEAWSESRVRITTSGKGQ